MSGAVDLELRPVSPAGDRLVKLADEHALAFAERAAEHDRLNTFPDAHWAAMAESGLLGACVPERLGGLGVTRVQDVVAAVNRLGRGDGSTAIGVNMHLSAPWFFGRLLEDEADERRVRELRLLLRLAGSGRAVFCVAFTEHGRHIPWPATEARRAPGGYRLDGRKGFATNSPACTVLLSSVRVVDDDGQPRLGFALVPRSAPGVEIEEVWDALGMRASGSHNVVYRDVALDERMVIVTGPLGEIATATFPLVLVNALGLAAAFLGIAEAAHAHAVDLAGRTRKAPSDRPIAERPAVQHQVGEAEVDLALSRGAIAAAARLLDEFFDGHAQADLDPGDLHRLMKTVQCVAVEAKRRAIEVVDRAMTVSGGAGYATRSLLSRLYRDVRAGPFMQPFSPLEAYEYIGRVALGLDPMVAL
ncbi:MAG: acyl-CoA/acyl-ACP dehydrogenase [Actinobacteria bacterium]|nr:acyl-CoA/acyl-ACP dehydrogenase [Actinomycetota bacterium]